MRNVDDLHLSDLNLLSVFQFQVGVYGFTSPVAARLVDRWGERRCCLAGGLVSALGLGLASVSASIPGLIIAYSVVTGVGFGLLYLPSVVIVPKYFTHKHRQVRTLSE